jgi:hypothetical protein
VLGRLDAQELAVGVKDLDDRIGDLDDGLSLLRGAADDLVVDVGQVHHLLDVPPREPDRAAQQVLEEERAEVAEVRRVVHGRPARVHPHAASVGGRERLDLAGQRVV